MGRMGVIFTKTLDVKVVLRLTAIFLQVYLDFGEGMLVRLSCLFLRGELGQSAQGF